MIWIILIRGILQESPPPTRVIGLFFSFWSLRFFYMKFISLRKYFLRPISYGTLYLKTVHVWFWYIYYFNTIVKYIAEYLWSHLPITASHEFFKEASLGTFLKIKNKMMALFFVNLSEGFPVLAVTYNIAKPCQKVSKILILKKEKWEYEP